MYSDGALTQIDKLVDDHEAHADALMVHIGRSFQLAKKFKEIGHLRIRYAFARVDDVCLQHLSVLIVTNVDLDTATLSELEGIFDQVDQDLFQTNMITMESRWQTCFWCNLKKATLLKFNDRGYLIWQACSNDLSLRLKHGDDKIEHWDRVEYFTSWLVLACLNQFEIKNIVDEAQKHIELGDDELEYRESVWIQILVHQIF